MCTALWRRHLYTVPDLVFEVPAGESFWSEEMHEPPIIIGIAPFFSGPTPGGFTAPLRCTQGAGNCAECGRSLICTQGLFCADFLCMASLPESVRLWHVLREMKTGWTTRGPRVQNQRGVTILTVSWYKGVELSN